VNSGNPEDYTTAERLNELFFKTKPVCCFIFDSLLLLFGIMFEVLRLLRSKVVYGCFLPEWYAFYSSFDVVCFANLVVNRSCDILQQQTIL
jgi:hypothetical protein